MTNIRTQIEKYSRVYRITKEIYTNDEINNPYDDFNKISGFTGQTILELCKELEIPLHIKWNDTKIEMFTPSDSELDSIVLYIWGDHCYLVNDEKIKKFNH